MTTISERFGPLLLALWLLVAVSCRKKEFLPPEIGGKVPYKDTTLVALDEALKTSPYTSFYQAWIRSGLHNRLQLSSGAAQTYTLLALNNETLQQAGWTTTRIAAAGTTDLDTLIAPYILKGDVSLAMLQSQSSAVIADSYHGVKDIFFKNSPHYYGLANGKKNDATYYQKAALSLGSDGKLVINGKVMGIAPPVTTDHGTIWPVEHMIAFTPKSTWEVLKADGRFTMYTTIIEYTDSVYNDLFFRNNNYYPFDRPWGYYFYMADAHYHHTPRMQGMVTYEEDGTTYVDALNTWFVPTDEAFQKAGLNSLQDAIAFNTRRGLPDTVHIPTQPWEDFAPQLGPHPSLFYQPEFIGIKSFFATDSILDYHGLWGMRSKGFSFWDTRGSFLVFSNDFTRMLHSDLNIGSLTYRKKLGKQFEMRTAQHYSPFIGRSANEVQVPGLAVDRVRITQPDWYTLNGVIHVVDNLFQPTKIQ